MRLIIIHTARRQGSVIMFWHYVRVSRRITEQRQKGNHFTHNIGMGKHFICYTKKKKKNPKNDVRLKYVYNETSTTSLYYVCSHERLPCFNSRVKQLVARAIRRPLCWYLGT
ncbi:unnamed protein product [Ixodes pacificus]